MFTCLLLFIFLVPPTSSNTNLTHPTTPGGFRPGDSATVDESAQEQFICVVTGSRPEPIISWSVGSGPPNEGVIDTVTDQNPGDPLLSDTTSTLTFVPRRQDHFHDLKCVATILVPGTSPYSFAVKLVVYGRL